MSGVTGKEKNVANATAIRTRLQSLRGDLDGFERTPADVSANRADLNSILARPEFHNVRGPSWLDRLKQRLLSFLLRVLERLFTSTAIPTVSKFFVYGVMGLAVLALAYFAYRLIWRDHPFEKFVATDLPVSAKEWAIWLAEARAAAAQSQWRDAIHLAYWAGISFLERQGAWKPDRARTPREYLRLISNSSGYASNDYSSNNYKETLTALTKIFELAWYAKREVSEQTFSQTLQELEKLGCH